MSATEAKALPSRLRNYVDLTKPRLLPMVLFTGLPALGMAATGWPSVSFAVLTLLGIALASASANTLNAYVERDVDAKMDRTASRPLPAGRLAPRTALVFGIVLAVLSIALLWLISGVAAAGLAAASILFYIFVYTVWLKPRSAWNAVVGGVAGAVSPLIADVAVDGQVGLAGLVLFAIVFFWQPPHVWAIALYRKADYERAGIPMLPNVIGDQPTRRWMVALLGPVYLAVAVGMNAWFIDASIRVLREQTDAAAQRMFYVSLAYLFSLYLAMLIDLLV